jgi:hypothetical protein
MACPPDRRYSTTTDLHRLFRNEPNALGEAGARALVESPLYRRLTALNLAGNGLPTEWLAELRRDFRGHLGG